MLFSPIKNPLGLKLISFSPKLNATPYIRLDWRERLDKVRLGLLVKINEF